MVQLVTAQSADDSSLVQLENQLVCLNSDNSWLLSNGSFELLDIFWLNVSVSSVLDTNIVMVVHALAGGSSERIVNVVFNTVGDGVVKSIVQVITAITA